MTFLKFLRGKAANLANKVFHDGYAYFTPDDGAFYIDAETDGEQKRIRVNPDDYIIEQNSKEKQKIWRGTKAEYDAITTKDANTLYIVTDEDGFSSAGGGVSSVNRKTGAVVLDSADVGAVAASNVTQSLGSSTDKIPSEKAVSDAMIHQLKVTITYNSKTKTYSADKTFWEIKTAYNNGYLIYCNFSDRYYSLSDVGTQAITFVSDNANETLWGALALKIDLHNKVTVFSTQLLVSGGDPDIRGDYTPGAGAVSAVCWYLRPQSDDTATYYLWDHRENGQKVFLNMTWIPILQEPDSYNLNIYYNGKVYEKAFFNAVSASDAPLTGKFIRMDYENGDIVCRVLSIDVHSYFMNGGSDSVIISEQILKVTTTTI